MSIDVVRKGNMKKFHFDGPTWTFLTPEQMYDEEGKLREAHKYYQNADIYFLTIMRKCLFDPSKTRVSLNGNINCEILVGDPANKKFERVRVSYPLPEIWYAMPSVKARFKSRNEFFFTVLFNQYTPKSGIKRKCFLALRKLMKKGYISSNMGIKMLVAIYSTEISVRHENRYEINIFDPLVKSMTDDDKAEQARKKDPKLYALDDLEWDIERKKGVDFTKLPGADSNENCRLKVDQIVNYFNVDIGGQRIAYIGKTEQEPFERLFPHTKLNELNGKLSINEFESLVLHLFGFMYWDEPTNPFNPSSSISKSDAITVAEAELINYFKPPKNDDYVKDKGKPKWKHIRDLKRRGYKKIVGLVDIEGQYAKFFTSHIEGKGSNRHEIEIDLSRYPSVQQKNTSDSQANR